LNDGARETKSKSILLAADVLPLLNHYSMFNYSML